MDKYILWGGILTFLFVFSGASFALLSDQSYTQPTTFYSGHTHIKGRTYGAPPHSAALDENGCHGGTVPYHCH